MAARRKSSRSCSRTKCALKTYGPFREVHQGRFDFRTAPDEYILSIIVLDDDEDGRPLDDDNPGSEWIAEAGYIGSALMHFVSTKPMPVGAVWRNIWLTGGGANEGPQQPIED